ncbi:Invasion protein B, involved in pathogenesis [Mesorhizobium sp. J18]|uniref:invasion associated locus B family protein n=1 Tax=Mesorhizobium sp. J18 TaxID=935263 RepID=UPI00119B6E59|nr:invasion associated locus B family protein [Mesorhizobium sp. J18]TWG91971.1 Invasion protein B, involved in pathogenesis [Mesorhizobium sp. J18]
MPFGLDLASGAELQIDDGTPGQALHFRTCLPAGCAVSVNIDAEMLTALRNGTTLKVHAKADGGNQTVFSISLKGFGGAFDRAAALAE